MITRKPIVFAMGVSDMSNTTLYHEISKYKDICMADVDAIIQYGIEKGYLERYERVVAWILNLKRFFPKGWKPTLRVVAFKPVQLTFGEVTAPSKGRGRDWEDGEFERAQIMKDAGDNYDVIAHTLDRTETAIRTKFAKKKKEK